VHTSKCTTHLHTNSCSAGERVVAGAVSAAAHTSRTLVVLSADLAIIARASLIERLRGAPAVLAHTLDAWAIQAAAVQS
jgi:hypothetical protein